MFFVRFTSGLAACALLVLTCACDWRDEAQINATANVTAANAARHPAGSGATERAPVHDTDVAPLKVESGELLIRFINSYTKVMPQFDFDYTIETNAQFLQRLKKTEANPNDHAAAETSHLWTRAGCNATGQVVIKLPQTEEWPLHLFIKLRTPHWGQVPVPGPHRPGGISGAIWHELRKDQSETLVSVRHYPPQD